MDERRKDIPEQPEENPTEQDLDEENRDAKSGHPVQLDEGPESEEESAS
jgi:hypothetical protein